MRKPAGPRKRNHSFNIKLCQYYVLNCHWHTLYVTLYSPQLCYILSKFGTSSDVILNVTVFHLSQLLQNHKFTQFMTDAAHNIWSKMVGLCMIFNWMTVLPLLNSYSTNFAIPNIQFYRYQQLTVEALCHKIKNVSPAVLVNLSLIIFLSTSVE